MIFTELPLKGAFLVDLERHEDERGFFARSWCAQEFAALGLDARLAQCNLSHNPKRKTLRGLHYQVAPHPEAKLVTCVRGRIWDVVVDLRPGSPTFRAWHAVELDGVGLRALFIPKEFAHGFQTLADDSLVLYQISEFYHPESARGLRWDDPALAIAWPEAEGRVISERDRSYPLLDGP